MRVKLCLIAALITLPIAFSLSFAADAKTNNKDQPKVKFTIEMEKPQYKLGEQVTVNLLIENIGKVPVVLVDSVYGTIELDLKRNGNEVQPSVSKGVLPSTPFDEVVKANEVVLLPGNSFSLQKHSNDSRVGQEISTMKPHADAPPLEKYFSYSLNRPGKYALSQKYLSLFSQNTGTGKKTGEPLIAVSNTVKFEILGQ